MDTEQLAVVTKRSIQGIPQRQIAAEVGISNATVSRTQNRPDIKAIIEAEGHKIIQSGLHVARKVITRRAAEGLNKSADDITKDRSLKASIHITNIAGLSGNAPSTIINQLIYQGDTHGDLSNHSLTMLQRALGLVSEADIIDLTCDSEEISRDSKGKT